MRNFDILSVKVEAIQKVANATQTPTQSRTLVQLSLALLDDLWVSDRYQEALNLAGTALAAAHRTQDLSLVTRLMRSLEEAARLARAYEAFRPLLAALEQAPNDPETNLAVGKFYCLVKGDWKKGLPMLARANGSPLQSLAAKELEKTAPAIELADGWWELSQADDGVARVQLQGHAAGWYRQALPDLDDATKTRAENRLREAPAVP